MKTKLTLSMVCLASMMALSTSALAAGDIAKGEKVFKKKCKTCHTIDVGGKSKTGPNLAGFLSRPAASQDGYKYSKNLKAAGITWDAETLDTWLKSPKKMVKGTKMSMKVKKEKERVNVIAYLMTIGK